MVLTSVVRNTPITWRAFGFWSSNLLYASTFVKSVLTHFSLLLHSLFLSVLTDGVVLVKILGIGSCKNCTFEINFEVI